jgi:hypothetical protein
MNTVEWILYRNSLTDYLASEAGLKLDPERRAKFWKEIDTVNAKINSLMDLYNTNESALTVENYNPENEINNF